MDNIIENIKYKIAYGKIIFVVDISSSEDEKLIDFISKLSAKKQQLDDSIDCKVLLVNHKIEEECTFRTLDMDKIASYKIMGGGTDMEAAIKYAIDKELDIKEMFILTDGYTHYSMKKEDIPFDVTWLITTDVGTAYGEIIRI
jgi:predicted metal-dependent peptidase